MTIIDGGARPGITSGDDTPKCGEPHCTNDHRGQDPYHQATGRRLPASGSAWDIDANYMWNDHGGLFYLMPSGSDGINFTREAWVDLIADMQRLLELAGDRADAPADEEW